MDGRRRATGLFIGTGRAAAARSARDSSNPALAAMLERIADDGPDAFYAGANAQTIVATRRHGAHVNPSKMTAADLASYQAKDRAAGLRHLPQLPDLRHGAALVGRDRRC